MLASLQFSIPAGEQFRLDRSRAKAHHVRVCQGFGDLSLVDRKKIRVPLPNMALALFRPFHVSAEVRTREPIQHRTASAIRGFLDFPGVAAGTGSRRGW